MTDTPELLLAARPCSQCLTTRNRIVSGDQAAEIIRGCRSSRNHFVCHKGSAAGLIVHCRGVHDRFGSRAAAFAAAIGVPTREIDPDALQNSAILDARGNAVFVPVGPRSDARATSGRDQRRTSRALGAIAAGPALNLGAPFDRRWRLRVRLAERHGQLCRVLARGGRNSALIEFQDGTRHIVSRNAFRKVAP